MRGKWVVSKTIEIDASHVVEGYNGPCARLHGHRWKIELSVLVENLDDIGIGVDFGVLKKELESLDLDHRHLNEYFSPTTAEMFARYVYEKIREKGIKPLKVTIWETPTNKVEYFEE